MIFHEANPEAARQDLEVLDVEGCGEGVSLPGFSEHLRLQAKELKHF